MLNLVPEELEHYIAAHSTTESQVLVDLSAETRAKTDAPQMMVGHIQGLFLKLLARAMGARRVLEIGTFTGYSALAFAEGVAEDGEVITCDRSERVTAIARQFWDMSPSGKKIKLLLGDALESVRSVDGPFDIIFIDADKERYIDYWEACVPKLRRGGLVLADNVLRSGTVVAPKEPVDHAVVAFNQHVMNDRRVENVILPIRDGVTMACKL
jgi:caffeoyl-CoA O-methyltransferase